MTLRMYYFKTFLFIFHTTLFSMDQFQSWEIVRQNALNCAHGVQSNPEKTIDTSLNQDSFFAQDPHKIINFNFHNYYFCYEKEIHALEDNHQIKDCISALINQTKIALFIIEHSKPKKLSNKCRYNYFKKQKSLNWCANLIYSLELLKNLPLTEKKILYSLDVVSRFFSGKKENLKHFYSINTITNDNQITNLLRINIYNAKKLLFTLIQQQQKDVNRTMFQENLGNYTQVFGSQCIQKRNEACPLNEQLFTLIKNTKNTHNEQVYKLVHKEYRLFNSITGDNL